MQSPEELRKPFRIGKDGCRSAATEFSVLAQPLQPATNLPRNTFRSTGIGKKKPFFAAIHRSWFGAIF
jgi:hypothetical protein